jgi:hypothetical protein
MRIGKSLAMAGTALVICTAAPTAWAQNEGGGGGGGRRGNFDPAEFQQRMMENVRDHLSITNDDEWKIVEARVQKVMEARRDAGPPGLGRMFGRRGPGGPGGDNGNADRPRRGGGFFGGPPMPELEALNNAVDNKAPTEQVKAAMERYRAARKAKEAALEKAQADLRQILTVKQEAAALSMGLVN